MKLHDRCTMRAKRAKKSQVREIATDFKSRVYEMRRAGFEPATS